ncbi:WD40-repeat-containing domain protein [Lipomyces kononenkoae]|uniref:WD40-repeat-containing domain protein n=1 Tax=Lipomyces kononenkoae TaxID=34357 RepID=A0ACC3T103_LIPKO
MPAPVQPSADAVSTSSAESSPFSHFSASTVSSISTVSPPSALPPATSTRPGTLARFTHYIAGTSPLPSWPSNRSDLSTSTSSLSSMSSDQMEPIPILSPHSPSSPFTPTAISGSSTITRRKSALRRPNLVLETDVPLTAACNDSKSSRALLAGRGYMRIVKVNPNEILELVDMRESMKAADSDRIGYVSDMKWCLGNLSNKAAVASTNGSISLYDLDKPNSLPERLTGHKRTVNSISLNPFSPHIVVSGCLDGAIKFWDLRTDRPSRPVASVNGPESTRRVQVSNVDGNKICAIFDNGYLLRWDSRNLTTPDRRIQAHSGAGFCFDYHPYLEIIATGGRDRTIRVWDLRQSDKSDQSAQIAHPIYEIPTSGALSNVIWKKPCGSERTDSVDDAFIASSSMSVGDYRIQIWNLRRKYIPAYIIDYHEAPITALSWANEGIYGSQVPADESEWSDCENELDEGRRQRARSGLSKKVLRHRQAGTIWAASRDQRFVAHDVARSCPTRPVQSLPHQAFAWGPNDEFTFAALDKSGLRKDGLVSRPPMHNRRGSSTQKRSSGNMVMRMMLMNSGKKTEAAPELPVQYVASGNLSQFIASQDTFYSANNTIGPADGGEIGVESTSNGNNSYSQASRRLKEFDVSNCDFIVYQWDLLLDLSLSFVLVVYYLARVRGYLLQELSEFAQTI